MASQTSSDKTEKFFLFKAQDGAIKVDIFAGSKLKKEATLPILETVAVFLYLEDSRKCVIVLHVEKVKYYKTNTKIADGHDEQWKQVVNVTV